MSEGWLLMEGPWTSTSRPSPIQTHDYYGCDKSGNPKVPHPFGRVINAPDDRRAIREADAKALAFVQQKAAEGSVYHIEALMRAQLL